MCFGFNNSSFRYDARFRKFMELSEKSRNLRDRLRDEDLSEDEKLKLQASLKNTKRGLEKTMNFLRRVSA